MNAVTPAVPIEQIIPGDLSPGLHQVLVGAQIKTVNLTANIAQLIAVGDAKRTHLWVYPTTNVPVNVGLDLEQPTFVTGIAKFNQSGGATISLVNMSVLVCYNWWAIADANTTIRVVEITRRG